MSKEQNSQEENKALHISGVSKRFLPFNNISDLVRKVEVIKKGHKISSEMIKQTLKEKGIEFISIEYGVVIDKSLITGEYVQLIKNNSLFIEKVYKENGVVSKLNNIIFNDLTDENHK